MTESLCARKPKVEVDLTDEQIQLLLLEAETRVGKPESTYSEASASHVSTNISESQPTSTRFPKSSLDNSLRPYLHQEDEVTKVVPSRILHHSRTDTLSIPGQEGALKAQKRQSAKEKDTAGSDWFDLPKTDLTTELRRDLQLLRMRSVLDPKRHYKKESGKPEPPPFSQVGTVIQGPTEFFSARITKKDRKKTFVEEAMASERETKRFGAKYQDIQASKKSGKKSFYRSLKAKRSQKGK